MCRRAPRPSPHRERYSLNLEAELLHPPMLADCWARATAVATALIREPANRELRALAADDARLQDHRDRAGAESSNTSPDEGLQPRRSCLQRARAPGFLFYSSSSAMRLD